MVNNINTVLSAMYRINGGTGTINDKETFIKFVNDGRQLFDPKEWNISGGGSICALASQHQNTWHHVIKTFYYLDSNFIFKIKN